MRQPSFCQHTGAVDVPRTLIVTNDFPPRVGGVQQYVWNLAANLPPDRLRPDLAGADEVRRRHGIAAGRPLVVCVSRLVPRKGQDALIRAMPAIRRREPDAMLLIVGGGPYREALEAMAGQAPPGAVVFAGE